MDVYKKYARARDQIYHYGVGVRQHHDSINPKQRTPQLVQLMEIVEALVKEAQECFAQDAILTVQFDRYVPVVLPGFEELMEDTENPYRPDRG